MEPLIAYLHYLAIVLIAGVLVAEMVVCLKMALYIAIAALSIKPALSFLRWRRRLAESGALPPAPEIATARRPRGRWPDGCNLYTRGEGDGA